MPALAIYAQRVDRGVLTYHVVHTDAVQRPPGPVTYTIRGLEPGTYVLLAFVRADPGSSPRPQENGGSFTPAVACGLSVRCTDHTPIAVTVRGGETTADIDILDWYSPPGSFPSRPVGGEPFRRGERLVVCNPFADGLKVRAGAGTARRELGTIPNGTSLEIVSGPVGLDGYDWYQMRGPAPEGWVAGFALRRQ